MLTAEQAKKIGIRACIDKIGYEFCKRHEDNSVCSYGEEDGKMLCYVGVDDKPEQQYDLENMNRIVLDDARYMPYYACCEVDMHNGEVSFIEFCVPQNEQ